MKYWISVEDSCSMCGKFCAVHDMNNYEDMTELLHIFHSVIHDFMTFWWQKMNCLTIYTQISYFLHDKMWITYNYSETCRFQK